MVKVVKVSFNQLTTSDVFKVVRSFNLENADAIIDDLEKYFEKHGLVLASGSDSVKKIIKRYVKDSKVYSLLVEKIKSLFTQNDEFEIEFCPIDELHDSENDINIGSCFRSSRHFSINNLDDIGGKLVRVYKNKKYVARFIMIETDDLILAGNFYNTINLPHDFHKSVIEKVYGIEMAKYNVGRGDFNGYLPFYNNGDWFSSKSKNETMEILAKKGIHCNECDNLVRLDEVYVLNDNEDEIKWVCSYCYEEVDKYTICPICSYEVPESELVYNDYYEDYVCPDCDSEIVRCPVCDSLCHERHDMTYSDYYDDYVCFDCDNEIVECGYCGDLVHKDDAIYVAGDYYCNDHFERCQACNSVAVFTIEYRGNHYCEDCLEYILKEFGFYERLNKDYIAMLLYKIMKKEYNRELRNTFIAYIRKKLNCDKKMARKIFAKLVQIMKFGKVNIPNKTIFENMALEGDNWFLKICSNCGNGSFYRITILENTNGTYEKEKEYCETCFREELKKVGIEVSLNTDWKEVKKAVMNKDYSRYQKELIDYLSQDGLVFLVSRRV
ncbi:MAG: hypothetical protein QXW35_03530 [Candidatus Aenigmatarchaeota archaeon]